MSWFIQRGFSKSYGIEWTDELTIIRLVADFLTSSWPKPVLASLSPFKPLKTAVNTFICMASWRPDFACFIHSLKWSSICKRCLFATLGNICPKSETERSITATPSGRGPGMISFWKKWNYWKKGQNRNFYTRFYRASYFPYGKTKRMLHHKKLLSPTRNNLY